MTVVEICSLPSAGRVWAGLQTLAALDDIGDDFVPGGSSFLHRLVFVQDVAKDLGFGLSAGAGGLVQHLLLLAGDVDLLVDHGIHRVCGSVHISQKNDPAIPNKG